MDELVQALDEFRTFLSGKVAEAFEFDPALEYRLSEDWESDKQIPNAEKPGVYCFIDAGGIVVYVGMSEQKYGGIGREVCSHIGKFKGTDKWWYEPKILKSAAKLQTIPFDSELSWLAPALESYLIKRLDPKGNKAPRCNT
ncbi:MAG: hypothetical protein AMS15_06380 [Planctomycetes bacterium DG_23]|nr:MAG: hypothetical protein AMS15_06380 [Planctomycetes bacterium DG_23]